MDTKGSGPDQPMIQLHYLPMSMYQFRKSVQIIETAWIAVGSYSKTFHGVILVRCDDESAKNNLFKKSEQYVLFSCC